MLFTEQSIGFDNMKDLDNALDCGGYTYEMQYLDGPLADNPPDLSSLYTIEGVTADESAMKGLITDLSLIGTHTFALNCINGQFDDVSGRGLMGFYNSVLSSPITVTITNPCEDPTQSGVLPITLADLVIPQGD